MKTRVIQDEPDDDRPAVGDEPGSGEPDTPARGGDEPSAPAGPSNGPHRNDTTIRSR
jgi:hypothetical protein